MDKKLRIAVWYNLPSGGGKRALNDHLHGLKARGHEIVAWRPPIPQADYLPISEIVEEREVPLDLSKMPEDDGKPSRRGLIWDRYAALDDAMRAHSRQVAQEIGAGGFDVLFANSCRFFASPHLGRFVDLPRLLYIQEPNRSLHEAPNAPWPSTFESLGAAPLSRQLRNVKRDLDEDLRAYAYRRLARTEIDNAKSYPRILVNSNFSRETILRVYGLESDVCYLGIDASRFEHRGLPREPYVVSVGTFHASKGPEFIVRSLGTIAERRPPLVWVANTVFEDERARVEALAKELGVDLRIRQYVPDEELLDILNRASVMAYAPRLEPFGYAPLEANACGLPAVVVAEGGVKETVVDGLNGRVVHHRPKAMGGAIADLLANPEEARRLGERAAAHVRSRWTLERATDELEGHLREIAQG